MSKNRDISVDILKGLGILFVILGHISYTPKIIKTWLYSFHMPLFFVGSGIVFSISQYPNFISFFKKKFKSIVIPYFIYGIVLWVMVNLRKLLSPALFGTEPVSVSWDLRGILTSLLLGYRLHKHYFSMWFITSLFLGEIIFYFIVRGIKERYCLYGAVTALCILGQYLLFKVMNGFYWSMDTVPVCVAFLSLGYMLKSLYWHSKKAYSIYLFPFFLAGNLYFAALNYLNHGMTDLFACKIGNPVYYLLSACFGVYLIIIFAKNIGQMKIMEFFGRNSLVVYIFQNSFSIPIAKNLAGSISKIGNMFTDKAFLWLLVILFTLIISALLIQIIALIKRTANRAFSLTR